MGRNTQAEAAMLQGIADYLRDRMPSSGTGSFNEKEVYEAVDPGGIAASGTMDRLVRFLNDVQPAPWEVNRQFGQIHVARMGSEDVSNLQPPFEIIKARLYSGQPVGSIAKALSYRYGSYAEALRKVYMQVANLYPDALADWTLPAAEAPSTS